MSKKKKQFKSPNLIGFDQSRKETGYVIAQYHPVKGAVKLIMSGTIKRTTPEAVSKLMNSLRLRIELKGMPLAMIRERGYYDSKTPNTIGELECVGGWIEMCFRQQFGEKKMYKYFPNQWRIQVWGHTGGDTKLMSRKERHNHLKGFSLQWAQARFPEIEDHHQADALGILSCGGDKLTQAGVIIP